MKILQEEAVNAMRTGQVAGTAGVNQSAAPVQGTVDTSAAASESSAATVSFSSRAQDISKAQASVNAAPEVREDLVQSLKSRIDSGTYNVSGADIADMMMRRHAADNSANG